MRPPLVSIAAFLLLLVPASSAQVEQIAKFTGDDTDSSDHFGNALASSRERLIVGAYTKSGFFVQAKGAAYVFRREGARWIQQQELESPADSESALFGSAVALSDEWAFVGAPQDFASGLHSGSVWSFRWNGTHWVGDGPLAAPDLAANDRFGSALAISGDIVLVSAEGKDQESGAVYVFRWNGAGWIHQQKLVAPAPQPAAVFGAAVSVGGDWAFVGTPNEAPHGASASGAVHVYRAAGASWIHEQVLVPGGAGDKGGVGRSLASSSGRVAVGGWGSPPSVWIFRRTEGGWAEEQRIVAADATASADFSRSLALDDDTLLVSDPGPGVVHVYQRLGSSWTLVGTLSTEDDSAHDSLGSAVALSDDLAIVGADKDDEAGTAAGAVYVFDLDALAPGIFDWMTPGWAGRR